MAADGLTKRFGQTTALDDVSFAMHGPGLLGILGPNGAGKTTLLDILEGLSEPTGGQFRLFGERPKKYPRRRVGVVMQSEARLERVSTREYADLFAAIYGVADGTERILSRARLLDRATTPMVRLSGGEAARLFIAAAMVHQPELLFLDEPTAHLDPESKKLIGSQLRELAETCTIVMTTHDLSEAGTLCDRLLFLVGGRVRASGARDELVAGRTMEEAFFDLCSVRIRDGEEIT